MLSTFVETLPERKAGFPTFVGMLPRLKAGFLILRKATFAESGFPHFAESRLLPKPGCVIWGKGDYDSAGVARCFL
ncbi:MAG: hypothetical protein K2J81_07970, partial [Treponemataceae bacterium]|nr:hypothetical protein [Treponemataceae bacterium]